MVNGLPYQYRKFFKTSNVYKLNNKFKPHFSWFDIINPCKIKEVFVVPDLYVAVVQDSETKLLLKMNKPVIDVTTIVLVIT